MFAKRIWGPLNLSPRGGACLVANSPPGTNASYSPPPPLVCGPRNKRESASRGSLGSNSTPPNLKRPKQVSHDLFAGGETLGPNQLTYSPLRTWVPLSIPLSKEPTPRLPARGKGFIACTQTLRCETGRTGGYVDGNLRPGEPHVTRYGVVCGLHDP